MKILQVIPYFTPKRGGDFNACFNLSKQLARHDHEVTVLTTDFELDDESRRLIENEGVTLIPFHCAANIGLFLISPLIIHWLKKNIRNFDVVHLNNFRSYQNIIACHFAKKYHIPYILQPDNSVPRVIQNNKQKLLFDLVFGGKILRNAHRIIAISKQEAEIIKQMGINEQKIEMIYLGMDGPSVTNLPSGRFKDKYGISGRMLLYLGRLNKTKGLEYVIKAFSVLSQSMDDLALVIAGPDDGYLRPLERLVEDLRLGSRIVFTGFITEEEKKYAFVDADLFVHTVLYMGGVGLAPLEAVLYGTPVIVTEECGEIVKLAHCGCITPYGDVPSLIKTMKLALDNPQHMEQLVLNGKHYIQQNLTWERVALQVESQYNRLS